MATLTMAYEVLCKILGGEPPLAANKKWLRKFCKDRDVHVSLAARYEPGARTESKVVMVVTWWAPSERGRMERRVELLMRFGMRGGKPDVTMWKRGRWNERAEWHGDEKKPCGGGGGARWDGIYKLSSDVLRLPDEGPDWDFFYMLAGGKCTNVFAEAEGILRANPELLWQGDNNVDWGHECESADA